jgi:hypothetical protein
METAKFHIKIFKFQSVQRCFQLKDFTSDKINHIFQKFRGKTTRIRPSEDPAKSRHPHLLPHI